jgi:hypothetical protein
MLIILCLPDGRFESKKIINYPFTRLEDLWM